VSTNLRQAVMEFKHALTVSWSRSELVQAC